MARSSFPARDWRALPGLLALVVVGVVAGAAPAGAAGDWHGGQGWSHRGGVIVQDHRGGVVVAPPGSRVIIVPPRRHWSQGQSFAWRDGFSRRQFKARRGFGPDAFMRGWRAPERFYVPRSSGFHFGFTID